MMEIRAWPLELRSLTEQTGGFQGYASVFGIKDTYGTVFDRGCFKKTINDHGGTFPITWFHDPKEPIGLANISEDDRGLLVSGSLDLANDTARRVYAGLKFGYVTEMSHGFVPVRRYEDEQKVTHFAEVKLVEVALLTRNYAANPEAIVLAVRQANRQLEYLKRLEKEGATEELIKVAREIRGILERLEVRGATLFQDLPLAARDREWDAPSATQRVRRWAGAETEPNEKYRKAFLWYDSEHPELFGSYKLPYADVIDGTLTCIPRAIFNATARLDQTDISEADREAVRRHISKYYAKMRKEWGDDTLYPPWERKAELEVVLQDLTGAMRALLEHLAPGKPTPESQKPPTTQSEPVQLFHSLLTNLREYAQVLPQRR